MIPDEKILKFREILSSAHRPLFLFDDDPDGLASFLVLYRINKNGTGWPLKGAIVNEKVAERVNKYCPDLVVVLDKAEIEQEFIDKVKTKIIWLDHHKPVQRKNVFYINPQLWEFGNDIATSYWAYKIAKQDVWMAAVGIVSDWQMLPEDLAEEFYSEYSKLLPLKIKNPQEALFKTQIGKLTKIFSFNLKGPSKDVSSSVKILSRVEDPFDLLEGKNPQTKLILKRYEKHNQMYQQILNSIEATEDKVVLFKYSGNENSYTTDLSNELLYKYPNKLIIVARESNDSFKCSLRSGKFRIDTILEKILQGFSGTGGGHAHACGAVIPSEQFDDFVQAFGEELK